jgi:UDP-N-acetylglucosamine 2-epimerase (non-hydrolysing)
MKVLLFAGTRPNFVKLAALYKEISKRHRFEPVLVHSGQHYDRVMNDYFFDDLNIPEPDYNLNVSGGTHTYQTAHIMLRFETVLEEIKPDMILVVGDVNSTLAAALVAAQKNIPLGHVEAGLRSGDRTMPEELNRIVVDQLSDYLFVTEQSGIDNLLREGINREKIFFVGNVMIDTLLDHIQKAAQSDVLARNNIQSREYALVTMHRPATTDNRDILSGMLQAFTELSDEIPILFPIHPRTKRRVEEFGLKNIIDNNTNFRTCEPLGYYDFLQAMANARVVISDSGGIQEETTILGIPCLTIRNNTERPVTIDHGTNRLIGNSGENLLEHYRTILRDTEKNQKKTPPLWDGKAAVRIMDVLEGLFQR